MVTQTPNLSLSAKREALACIHGRYARAGRPHKTRILDEFGATCGYHRKAALRLLNRLLPAWPPKRRSLKPAGGSAAITEDFDQAVPQFRFNAEGAEVSQSDSPLRSSAPTSASSALKHFLRIARWWEIALQRRSREIFGARWQSTAATPLSGGGQCYQSGVALGCPPVWLQDQVRGMKARGIILTALSPFR